MMKKILSLLLVIYMHSYAFAQLNGDGFYRIKNYSNGAYMTFVDSLGGFINATVLDMHSIMLYPEDTNDIYSDPENIFYIERKDSINNYYNVIGQGTNIDNIINIDGANLKINGNNETNFYQFSYTFSGINIYLYSDTVGNRYGGYYGVSTSGSVRQRIWKFTSVNYDTDTYFGIKPTIQSGDKYYQPFYFAFPFRFISEGMKAYYVTKVEKNCAIMKEVTSSDGIIPAETPIIIECSSPDAENNKIEPIYCQTTPLTDNLLLGNYYCFEFVNNHQTFDSGTMRVLNIDDEGKLCLSTNTENLHQSQRYPNTDILLNKNSSYLPVILGTSEEIRLVKEDEYIEESNNYIAQGEVGTCIWYITADSTLVIAPADGVSGDLPEGGWDFDKNTTPWYNYDYRKGILAARIEPGVNAKSCKAMFDGLSNMTSIDLSNFDTQNVTSMNSMFSSCSSLTSLDLSSFDTQNVTDMFGMFYGCSSLTELDLSNFNTQNVTSMGYMFNGCSSLTSLDLSSFDTQNVTIMGYMFYGCSSLTSLDLSNFNTQNVTSMGDMFEKCLSLTSLNLTNFNTQKVQGILWYMFSECSSLNTIISNNERPSKLKEGTFSDSFTNRKNCTLIVPKGSKARYAAADGWNELGNIEEAAVNMIYVENGVTKAGEELALPVYMENPDEISAFQFDVTLPEGMKLGEDGVTLDTLRTTEEAHTLTYREIEDGVYRVVCYSTDLATFSGNDGVVAYIHLIADTVGNYQVKLSGIEMSTVDMTKFTPEESVCEITVETSTNDLTYMQFAERIEETLSALSTTQSNTVDEYLDEDDNVTNTKYAEIVLEYLNVFKDIATSIDKINDAATIAHENGVMAESIEDLTAALDSIDAVLAEIPAEFEADIAERNTYIARGETGTCSWIIDNDGLLTIAPADGESGDLPEGGWNETYDDNSGFFYASEAPWYVYHDTIFAAKVEPGVNAKSCYNMFSGLDKMKTIDISNMNTQDLTNTKWMFRSCASLSSIDLSTFNTGKVTDMHGMFDNCKSITELDLSHFDTKSAKSMNGLFFFCENLVSLDLTNFDTENVEDMAYMFGGCYNLKTLNLTNFTNIKSNDTYLFPECRNLTTIISDNETPSALVAGTFNYFDNSACTLIVPKGTKELYAAADGWNELGKIIDDDDIAEDLFGELAVSVSEDENIATDALEDLALTFPNALAGTEGYEDYVMSLNGDAKVVLVDSEGTTVEEAYAHEVDSVGTVEFSAKLKRGEEYTVIVPRGLYTIDNEEKTYESAADTLSYTTDYVLGDVNNDSRHSVTDIVGVASYILNGSEEVGLLVVDCNRDEEATVTDISHLASKIMTGSFPWEEESPARLVAPVAKPQLYLTDNAHGLALSFDNARDFCSMQFDVTLTDDLGNNITSADAVKVKAGAGTQGHTVATGMVDGKMRVLVYSVANKAFASDFNVNLNANLNYDCEVSITNAELTSNALTAVPLEGIEAHLSTTDGINSLTVSAETSQLYDLAGRRLSNPTARGIYVVGKKKVVK